MELGKISQLVRGDSYLLVRRRWLTRIFVVGDVLSFLAQGAGGGLMASPKSSQTGSNIVVAGLFVQVLFFGTFVIVALLFHSRLHRKPTGTIFEEQPPYSRHMVVLYTASLLIFLRSIVRIVEFIQGFSGYIMSHCTFSTHCLCSSLFWWLTWYIPARFRGYWVHSRAREEMVKL